MLRLRRFSAVNMKIEIILALIILILLVLFLNPLNFFMPPAFLNMMIVFLIAIFGAFIVLVWREKPKDEREKYHSMSAARLSLILGGSVLALGIIIQELFLHSLDPWLVYALGAIIFGKLIGIFYIKRKN
jgi:uncharacterized membrane protein